MARYLVVAHQTAGSPELREHIEDVVRGDSDAKFGLVVPATPVSHLFTWSEEETMAVARRNMERAAALVREAGGDVVRSVVGSRFPLDAITDELRENPGYDEVIVCTFPPGVSRWLKRDLITQAQKRTRLPVTHITARPAPQEEAAPVAAHARPAEAAAPGGDGATATETPPPPPHGREAVTEREFGHLDLPYIDREDLPEGERDLWDRLVEGRDVPSLFRVMGNNRSLLQGYVEMLNATWNESGLDDQTRELVILRVALLQRAEYVWHEHVQIGRELGLSDDIIRSLEHWQSTELVRFDERQRAVLAYVDAVARDREPPNGIQDTLRRYYGMDAIVGLTLVIGFYRMTGGFAKALHVEPEGRFVGWQLY